MMLPSRALSRAAAAASTTVLALALAGCGSDVDQVGDTVSSYYRLVSEAKFSEACQLYDPGLRQAAAAQGDSCEENLASQYDTQARAAMTDIKVDPKQIRLGDDRASVPKTAVTFAGKPSEEDLDLIKRDEDWFLYGGG